MNYEKLTTMINKKDELTKIKDNFQNELDFRKDVAIIKVLLFSLFIISPIFIFIYEFMITFLIEDFFKMALFMIHILFALITISTSKEDFNGTKKIFLVVSTIPILNILLSITFILLNFKVLIDKRFIKTLFSKNGFDEVTKEINNHNQDIEHIESEIELLLEENINNVSFINKAQNNELIAKMINKKIKNSIEKKGYLEMHKERLMTIQNS